MSKESLYNIEYLEQTMKLFREIKEQSYAQFLKVSEGVIADIGCGTGQDVINLSGLLPETVQLMGIDANEEMIQKAQSLQYDNKRVQFQLGNAENLPFDTEYLSGIRNERLIQHVPDLDKAFSEFYRVLKPGAPLTIVETDWNSFTLYNAPPEFSHRIRNYYMFNNVPNGSAALHLSYFLRSTGFKEIKLQVFPVVSRALQQVVEVARLGFILQEMQAKGFIDTEELQTLNENLEYADNNQHFVSSVNMVIATAVK
jgi:ubiquinone/menaquinone biosynthesis C-methylase UbiE